MSRLESMIRRLKAQVACLDMAADAVRDVPGPVLELGLGNGRTYDHLREKLADRDILVFERHLIAHPDCVPEDRFLHVGNLEDTLPPLVRDLHGRVALIHADLGTADERYPISLEKLIVTTFPKLLAPGGLALTDKPIDIPGFEALKLPRGVPAKRYFMYQRR